MGSKSQKLNAWSIFKKETLTQLISNKFIGNVLKSFFVSHHETTGFLKSNLYLESFVMKITTPRFVLLQAPIYN